MILWSVKPSNIRCPFIVNFKVKIAMNIGDQSQPSLVHLCILQTVMSTSKRTKHKILGALLEVEMFIKVHSVVARSTCPKVKMYKTLQVRFCVTGAALRMTWPHLFVAGTVL